MSFKKNGTVAAEGLTNTVPLYGMRTKTLEDGSTWCRIHYLDVSSNTTYFQSKEEVLECTNAANRFSRMGIVDKLKNTQVKLTNLVPEIDGTTNFSGSYASADSTYKKYGKNSLKITANTGAAETTATSTYTINVNNTHTYYARVEILQTTQVGSAEMFWPVAAPNMISGTAISATETWKIVSAVKNRSSFTDGQAGKIRLDFNNSNSAGEMYYNGLMLIDLTEAFGAGNEPTKEWCDANIPYFKTTKTIDILNSPEYHHYEFMLNYPSLSTTLYNRWKQKSSPNESTVVGFYPITTAWSLHNAGIRKHGSATIYNCDSGTTWFAPIGQTAQWSSADNKHIPAADGSSQTSTGLWIRIDLLSPLSLARIYKNEHIVVNDYIEI